MTVTLPECAGVDRYPLESDDTCPTFLGCLIDGERMELFVPFGFCCRIAWYDYLSRWNLYDCDPITGAIYTLPEEPCTA